jgi:Ser/Thr protein kinase RdoA (MazF antagonist)
VAVTSRLASWPAEVFAGLRGPGVPRRLAGVPAREWVERDRWSVAERVAWDGAYVDVAPELVDLVDALRAATRPVRLPAQLVHGDLAGNALFAPGQAPAVIDFSPCRRPPRGTA